MNMILRALMVSVWFMALTFPLVVLKVDALNDTILFRWENMASIGVGAFVLSIFWRWSMERKARGAVSTGPSLFARALEAVRQPKPRYTCLGLIAVLMLVMPYISSMYQINIMISALIYIMLGLGLNIVVGLAGQLVLGYAAFYAVGAYTYGLLNTYFGLGFWAVLPVGGIMAALFGLMLGFPVLRLKGDYLAIVTLGFGEIIRLVLENWTSVTKGSFGLSNLSRPSLFGMEMGVTEATNYIYYIVLAAVVVTIIVVGRLKNSRIGLALQALREDEIACEAMGIDLTKVKLSAFALGSCWAGFAGVIFAAKTTFINPASFTFMESAMVLSMVVLGGMGSVLGVTIAAAILVLAPEYLRAFSEYRMLLFGAVMVIMMIYRPQGLISGEKRTYKITNKDKIDSSKSAFDVPATGDQPAGDRRAHRPQRGGEDHVLQLHHRHLSAHRRDRPASPARAQRQARRLHDPQRHEAQRDHVARHGPHVPEHPSVPDHDRARKRHDRTPLPHVGGHRRSGLSGLAHQGRRTGYHRPQL